MCQRDLMSDENIRNRTDDWHPDEAATPRGFARATFFDTYGQACSLQESSVMPHLWLGPDGCRMHLSVDQVRGLVEAMTKWLPEGE